MSVTSQTIQTSSATEVSGRRLPGDPGVWLFIALDSFMFCLFFGSFMYERLKNVELFNHSQQALSPTVGAVNTLLLLAGSWFVVLAVHAAKSNRKSVVINCLSMAIVSGGAFGVSKLLEYQDKFAAGISMMTDDFYMFYFVLTGMHFVHLIIGLVLLFILLRRVRRIARSDDQGYLFFLESGASYWHMVDLLWIVLFPLLYLVR